MKTPQQEIDELLRRPSEGLNVEVKTWLNPSFPADIAKIVKGTFALRNRNGGFFIIGLNDKTLKPDSRSHSTRVQEIYHTDAIQSIISKYASSLFEIEVTFGQVDGVDIPVIVVPSGVTFPVATKAHLRDANGKSLIAFGQIYFRTLNANGTPSTAAAQPQDWKDIVEICFENREADLGRFLRRLVGSGTADVGALLQAAVRPARRSGDDGGTTAKPLLRDRALELLDEGMKRFGTEVAQRKLSGEAKRLVEGGSWEVALIIDPPKVDQLPTESFRQILASSNPRFTGWPVWLDSSDFRETANRPVVRSGAWETFVVSVEEDFSDVDFYRFDPNGKFYLYRNLQDDASNKVRPGTALDPILVVIRLAEAVAVGLAFAKALGWPAEQTTLGFATRWTKIRGRKIHSWANNRAYFSERSPASDDVAVGFCQLHADTPANAIAPTIETLARPLFVLFGGFEMPKPSIEQWVQKLIERRLD
jgi:hypothetical protein